MPRQPQRDFTGVTRLPPWLCPSCGLMNDAVGTVDGSPGEPQPGDALICLHCAAIRMFESRTVQRAPTAEEEAAFASDPDWAELRAARARLLTMQRRGFRTTQQQRGQGRPQ